MKSYTWHCIACGAQNHESDGECQFCKCGGLQCRRDNCSDPQHFHAEHTADDPVKGCKLCHAVQGGEK